MRKFATTALVCCAFTALIVPSARADFLLNCRLLDTGNPIWKQHCKAETREPVRVRCRDRFECLALKKLILSQGRSTADLEAVGTSPAPSVTGTLGSTISNGGNTLGGTVEGAGGTVGGVVGGVSPSGGETVGSTGSVLGGTISRSTNTLGGTVTGAGGAVGNALNR
jgi:hypothetical protein